jgi:hypothetical protein
MKTFYSRCLFIIALAMALLARDIHADEPERNGPWLVEHTLDRVYVQTAEMVLHPQPEPQPALKYRLVPDAFDLLEGNSAIYYLKAMGFLEQTGAANELQKFRDKYRKQADEQGVPVTNLPPYSWEDMAPKDLPIEEVKQYLSYTAFQPPLIAEATRRPNFTLDRNMRSVDNAITYLLPEIQDIRELARTQSIRCRLAIAENRIADAVAIQQQQMTLAKHVGGDEFLVSNLVGAAILGIAVQDMVYLLQHPEAPNIYWAFASLPVPIINAERSLPLERQFLMLQVKALREVDETPRPSGYWQDFVDRILPQIRGLEIEGFTIGTDDPQISRAAFVTYIAAAYPGAKRYLLEELKLERAQVDAYPTAQVVFLAAKRYHERSADNAFKWFHLPFDQVQQLPAFKQIDEQQAKSSSRLGWASAASDLLLPALGAFRSAQIRTQQQVGLMQTIEAIRMYAAANAAKLPATLRDLPYPAPNDPFTGQPFTYQVDGEQAVLSGQPTPIVQYRFKLSVAK